MSREVDVATPSQQRDAPNRGPLLSSVVAAHEGAAELLSGARMVRSAALLVEFAQRHGGPVLVPVSPMASRLVGAALLYGGDEVRAGDEGSVPTGQHVLLVEAVASAPAGLLNARQVMLAVGAASVECVALQLIGTDDSAEGVNVLLPSRAALRLAAGR